METKEAILSRNSAKIRRLFLSGKSFNDIGRELRISGQAARYKMFGCNGTIEYVMQLSQYRDFYLPLVRGNLEKIPRTGYSFSDVHHVQIPMSLILSRREQSHIERKLMLADFRDAIGESLKAIEDSPDEHEIKIKYHNGAVLLFPFTLASRAFLEALGEHAFSREIERPRAQLII